MEPDFLKMERRMAALFLLALILIAWQAMRTEPALQPAFEIATRMGEQLAPLAVPSWRPAPELPADLSARRAFLASRSVPWPLPATPAACRAFIRISSQHWAWRPFSRPGGAPVSPWQRLVLPVAAFLDDDDGNGDPLDDGELRESGPGAEVEVFCL